MGDGACGVYIAASHHNDIFFCLMAYTIFCLAFSRDIDFKICKCFIYFDDVRDIFRWSKSIKENLVMFICIHIWSIISYPVRAYGIIDILISETSIYSLFGIYCSYSSCTDHQRAIRLIHSPLESFPSLELSNILPSIQYIRAAVAFVRADYIWAWLLEIR